MVRCPDPLAAALLSAQDDSTVCTLESALIPCSVAGDKEDNDEDDDMSRRCADPVARRYLESAEVDEAWGEEKKDAGALSPPREEGGDEDEDGPGRR